jgi:hypothetical protein
VVSNSDEISDSRLGREVAFGGRGGATTPTPPLVLLLLVANSINELSSRERSLSNGSRPPFSLNFVNSNLREQIYPEGVTIGSLVSDPVSAHV